ncbi:hypothetical protein [Actibacterium lipolyticum]|uniref:DUF3299 domain-containing protein n=1 Tax=Actibacterium lipolyticum TaxID=1524263 RepID=A0A238KP81_9RHOB|nr:hypothetical protein [Actibacterium lipolyticum]SMX44450.1 hypothetical protein COL8621_02558 [Actibacterium lipolyticum]
MMNRRHFLLAATSTGLISPVGVSAQAAPIAVRDLYNKDLSFSDLALSLEGKEITVTGFMAPPLKADGQFFVLTKKPMSVCPFCETEAEWPDDIMAIYTKRQFRVIPFNVRIEASGVLELGPLKDPETGFLSRVRLTAARYS